MIKATDAVKHFEKLYSSKAVYLWGANCQTITEDLCKKLFKSFGNATYNKAYYDRKLAYGKGRIGADCSGAFFPISGFDDTAQGYYNRCPIKGKIGLIPASQPCLVFKGKTEKRITHIGFYLGDGNVIEMKSSKDDCVKRTLKAGKWDFHGIPTWISYELTPSVPDTPTLRRGDHNVYVLHWQKYLQSCLMYTGELDGEFGPLTEKAVKDWQEAQGLNPDGVIGAKTWAKLGI